MKKLIKKEIPIQQTLGLFSEEDRYSDHLRIMTDVFKDVKYCYATIDSILSYSNKINQEVLDLSARASTLLLSLEIIKLSLKNQIRFIYSSQEMRNSKFREIDEKLNTKIDYIFSASRGLSVESGLIIYDKCRSFNTARLNGLKRTMIQSREYLDKIINLLNDYKY